jgi:hypothetical protein
MSKDNAKEEEIEEEEDYYTLLGVKRTATKEEIKRAYKKLARTFHPDHHRDQELNQRAEQRFVKIGQAYDVLVDDEKRAIYDVYGAEAIKANVCQDLVKRNNTLDELKRHLEKAEQKKKLKLMEEKLKMKGKITAYVTTVPKHSRFPVIVGIQLNEYLQSQIDDKNMMLLGGTMTGQQGGNNLLFGWRRYLFPNSRNTFFQAQVFAGPGTYNVRTIAQAEISTEHVGSCVIDVNQSGSNLTLHFWEVLSRWATGDLQLSIGQQNLVKLGARRKAETTHMTAHLKFSDVRYESDFPLKFPGLEVSYKKQLNKKEALQLKGDWEPGNFLPYFTLGYERTISQGNKIGILCVLGNNGSSTLVLSYKYFGQKVALPLILTHSLNWVTAVAFVGPAVAISTFNYFWLYPYSARKKKE